MGSVTLRNFILLNNYKPINNKKMIDLFANFSRDLDPNKSREELIKILTDIELERRRDAIIINRNKNRCQDESDEQLKFNAIHN